MVREYLPDVTGPDGVRVTLAVEHAVERFVRLREAFGMREFYLPFNGWFNKRLAQWAQHGPLRGRWAVAAEADSGERVRAAVRDKDAAVALAAQTRDAIARRGVAALADLRRSPEAR